MSFLMILRIAVKALNRNKMRTALTMLGMIIGVAAVITMVALGTGAQTSIEAQIQSAGTNMIIVSAGNFSQGGVRQGQGNASTLVPDDAAAIAQLPGVQYTAAGSNTRGQIVAGNQNWNTQVQGTDVDFPLIRAWPTSAGRVLHAAGRRDRVEGRGARQRRPRSAVRAGRRSDRPGDPHHQPAVHRRRRDGQQGPVGHGPGSGRRDLRALHDGDEEAARHHQHPERHRVGGVGRRGDEGRRQHRHRCCACATRFSRAIPTTSWSARWRKWPASARKRRRR